jgi:hypothetical protein
MPYIVKVKQHFHFAFLDKPKYFYILFLIMKLYLLVVHGRGDNYYGCLQFF